MCLRGVLGFVQEYRANAPSNLKKMLTDHDGAEMDRKRRCPRENCARDICCLKQETNPATAGSSKGWSLKCDRHLYR